MSTIRLDEKVFDEILRMIERKMYAISIGNLFDDTPKKLGYEIKTENVAKVGNDKLVQAISRIFEKKYISCDESNKLIENIANAIADRIGDHRIVKTITSDKTLTTYLCRDSGSDIDNIVNRFKLLGRIYYDLLPNYERIEKLQHILVGNFSSCYDVKKILRPLLNVDCKTLLLLSEIYLSLINNNYELFEKIEWLLILLNIWSEMKGGYLPVYASRVEAYAIYYLYVYKCSDKYGIETVGVDDFVRMIFNILNIEI